MNFLKTILFVFIILYSCQENNLSNISSPIAVKGVIDLSSWDFEKNGMARLDGEWEFYWMQLLTPEDFITNKYQFHYFDFPGRWDAVKINSQQLPPHGYATFRLKVLLNQSLSNMDISIYTKEHATSYRIYVNEKEVAGAGKVSTNPNDYIPHIVSSIGYAHLEGNSLVLTLNVANFDYREGGPWNSIWLGNVKQAAQKSIFKKYLETFTAGILFIIFFYHISIFLLRRTEITSLVFALLCLVIFARTVVSGEKIAILLFNIPYWIYFRIEYISFFMAIAFGIHYIHTLFKEELKIWIVYIFYIISILFSLFVIFTPARIYSYSILVFQYFFVLGIGIILYALIIAMFKKRPNSFLVFGGGIVFILSALNDLFFVNGIFRTTYISPFGLIFLIFSQTFVITKIFIQALILTEELTVNLENKVNERTKELEKERNELQKKNDIIENDLEMARKVQQQLIPSKNPINEIFSLYWPTNRVGGDFYDFIRFRELNKIGIFISDVSGHGVPAAIITSMIKSFISQSDNIRSDPAGFLYYLNNLLLGQTSDSFVTAFYGIYDIETKELYFSNAGHNDPLIINSGKIYYLRSEKKRGSACYNEE